jgi:hypothetical protein
MMAMLRRIALGAIGRSGIVLGERRDYKERGRDAKRGEKFRH